MACSLFAHHYSGNRGCFLFLWVLRCFTSPRFLHLPYVFRQGRWAITPTQVSLFGNPRIEVWLPTPRGLSQAPTSFFGSWCQGIHRVPLSTWQLQMMLASTVQFSKYGRSRPTTATRLWQTDPAEDDPSSGRSLRTQQRARPVRPPGSGFPCRGVLRHSSRTNLPGLKLRPNNQCSTNEQPPRDDRPRCGSGREPPGYR